MGFGLCRCGCGLSTSISDRTDVTRGLIVGMPRPYRANHRQIAARKPDYMVGPGDCWLWLKHLNKHGYGMGSWGKGLEYAHRHYYAERHGTIPIGLVIDHLCKNRCCVNPDHLEAITQTENVRRSSFVKLTIEQVREIRRRYDAGSNDFWGMSREFGVSVHTARQIAKRRHYREVEELIPAISPVSV